MGNWIPTILSIGATLIISIIAYFLKRSVFTVLDEYKKTIEKIQTGHISKDDYKADISAVKASIKEIRDTYTPKAEHDKAYDECRSDIKQIKEDYITREDFFREQSKTDRKLDRIMDILLKMSGGGN